MDKLTAEAQLIQIVTDEITNNEMEQVWVTDKVAFNMREMIKQFRKNYWGVFDEPNDPITKKEKVWVPLTRMLCDAVRKNVDLDPKDMRFRSKNPKQTHVTHIVRGWVREWLSRHYFGHTLNQTIFTNVVDGTSVWKTYFIDGKIVRKDVDLLNVYIDPTAVSIQEAYRFTERILMTQSEVRGMDGWDNTKEFTVEKDLEREDGNAARKTGMYGDVYEMWGMVPNKYLTLDDNDETEVEAQIVISGIDTGTIIFHFAEKNTQKDKDGNSVKPYEEAWYVKVPGRWYGVGISETVMSLQYWVNTVINLRINKNTIAQLGLLKIKRGSDVTQQMLSNLISNGVIELNDPETDLTQLDIRESGQSSYQDEEVAKNWAQDVTSVFDVNLGQLPASTSATGAVIQDRQAKSAFTLVTESMEYFLQRWMDRHFMPNVPKMMKANNYATIFKDFDDIKALRERVVANIAMKGMQDYQQETGKVPSEEQMQAEVAKAEKKLEARGDMMFEVLDEIIVKELDTEVFMTNQEVDVAVTVRNLLELKNGLDPIAAADMTAEALDLLGIRVPDSIKNPQVQQAQPQQAQGAMLSEQGISTEANALNNEQR